jgi:hypothetical protein
VSNYTQPDYRVPQTDSRVGNEPTPNADKIQTPAVPTPNYVEPGPSDKDDPQRTYRGPNRTKLGF